MATATARSRSASRDRASGPDASGARHLTLTLGFATIPITLKPITGGRKSGIAGKTLCPEHKEPLSMRFLCGEGCDHEHLMPKGDTVIGYETSKKSGEFVLVDEEIIQSIVAERSQTAEILKFCSADIDPIWFEKTYLVWPQSPAAEQAYDTIAALMREDERAIVYTATLGKETRQYVLRWSGEAGEAGSIVAHQCFFDADIRWKDVSVVSEGIASRDGVPDQAVEMARTVLMQSDGDFEATEVEDTYVPALEQAIAAAASGTPLKAPAPRTKSAPAGDFLAALTKSVEATKTTPAKKKATPRKKKVTA